MALAPLMRLRLLDAVTGMHPVDAAVRCLAVACQDLADPAGLPLGQRDAALLALRRRLLGDRLRACATCAECGETSTLEISVADLLEPMSGTASSPWEVQHRGRTLSLRALTSRDLAAAVAEPSPQRARDLLVLAALDQDEDGHPEPVSEELAGVVAASIAEHDPGAEILLTGTCSGCGEPWSQVLEPARFVTAELAHEGARLLADVAALARAFGWTESDVLELSDARRRAYLDLALDMAG